MIVGSGEDGDTYQLSILERAHLRLWDCQGAGMQTWASLRLQGTEEIV